MLLSFLGLLVHVIPVSAAGVNTEGWAVVRVSRFENKGLMYSSFEGVLEWAGFDPNEKCDDRTGECYTPTLESRNFSVRETNEKTVRFIGQNLNKELLIKYRIHRVTPIKLSTDFEIEEAYEIGKRIPQEIPKQFLVDKTGKKRNFSVRGKFLKIERTGTVIKTFEILYYDREKDRIHPASITDREMAELAIETMKYDVEFYFGVSESYVSGVRESDFDIFEINYASRAGLGKLQ